MRFQFLKKGGLYSDIYSLISFKLGVMIETTELYILISVWMTLTFIQGCTSIRNQNFDVHFLVNLGIDFDEIQSVTTTC